MDANRAESQRAIRVVKMGLSAHHLSIMWLVITATWTGVAIVMTGAPNFIEEWFSPWSRVAFGSLAFFPGTIAIAGAFAGIGRIAGWYLQVIGLAGLALWYAAMGVSYTALLIQQGGQFVQPGQPLEPHITGRGYVPLIYLCLLGLAVIPLVTTIRIGRPSR